VRRQEFEQLMATGSADAIIQAASRAPEEMRWQLQHRAVMKALEDGSPERARQIANDAVADPRQREQLLREIDQHAFWRASSEGDTSRALALLARFKLPEERMQMTLSLAQAAASRGHNELAGRLLEEVLGQTGVRARDMGHFSIRLQAARAFAQFAPERAFEIAEAGVEQLNELLTAAAQIDGFGQESFEQGELKLEGNIWSSLMQQSGEVLSLLAPKDFDRAREVAARFQRPEARSHALLAVARGVLGDNNAPGRGGDMPMRGRQRVRPIRLVGSRP
jgi:hypothetical protein